MNLKATLYIHITAGHSNFLESTLILIVRIIVCHINFQPMLNFQEVSGVTILCCPFLSYQYVCRKSSS